ncbi:hypothetical protein [Isoptericola croceus]|uniref:hypothetical protein n=1 Tax=Isoptericola croceus TaxID=3031406 RepID=UPI0023F81DD9|nr:hypothetical protein [Isoptericola croceus]
MTLEPQDVRLIDGMPTTTPERTIADLVRSGHDLSHVAGVFGDAVRTGQTTTERTRQGLLRVLGESRTQTAWPTILRTAELDPTSIVEHLRRWANSPAQGETADPSAWLPLLTDAGTDSSTDSPAGTSGQDESAASA